MINKSN